MILLLLHIILCIIYAILDENENRRKVFPWPIVVFIPFCGFALWLVDGYVKKLDLYGNRDVDLDTLKVTDVKYRRLEVDADEDKKVVVPLEEALIVNDTMLRRELMIDILHKNPEEYLTLLEKASGGNDVEVTHYATTTLIEIQSDYEKRLKKKMTAFDKDRSNMADARAYRDELISYTESGLIEGSILETQRKNLVNVLTVLIDNENKKYDILQFIKVSLDLKQYDAAKKMIDVKETKLSSEIEWYKLAIRYYWELGKAEDIKNILGLIEERNVYLSRENKDWYQFWVDGFKYE